MKISEFMKMLGDELYSLSYEIHWFDKNGTELDFSTSYKEAVVDIFGHYCLSGSDSIYITTKENKVILQLYAETSIKEEF